MSTKETTQLRTEVDRLKNRVSELVDELTVLRREVDQFKSQVVSDIKYLNDRKNG